MKVLVTGGTGVIGTPAVRQLIERGHSVRLLSRNASRDQKQFPGDVEARDGSITSDREVHGAAEGCDAVLHIAGISEESGQELTFERVNVHGTELLVREAERAGCRRFVLVSSLGADRGASDYHRSKFEAEKIAQTFTGEWVVVRPGNVYGPGDEVISRLLTMIRTLPAIPVLGGGDDPFQPIATEDLAEALVLAVERRDLARRSFDLAGDEATTVNEILDHLERITEKSPPRVPTPTWLASVGSELLSRIGFDRPVTSDQITMLEEGNVLPISSSALREVFGVSPTSLEDGLKALADELPEQLPSEGVGSMHRRRYWAGIDGSDHDAESLFELFRNRFASVTPDSTMEVGVEPRTPRTLQEGGTITMALPLRGNIQVRVVDVSQRSATVVTVAGHPLAGAVRFLTEPRGESIHFEVQTFDRAANPVDLLAISTIGRLLKSYNWKKFVEHVVELSGGSAPDGIETESEVLDEEQAEKVQKWVADLVMERKAEA